MSDLWEEMANQEVAAPPTGGAADMPDKLQLIVATATEANGGAAPIVKDIGKDKPFWKFKLGTIVAGGVAQAENYKGRYVFVDLNVNKPTDEMLASWLAGATDDNHKTRLKAQIESNPKLPLDGALYNLMLDTLAPEGETTQERWRQVLAVLRPTQADLDACTGDKELMLAIKFKTHLLTNSYKVMGRTYTPKQKANSTFVPNQTLGSVEACTDATMAKRKVKLFEEAF